MSVALQVLSATNHYAKCILTACIIKMGVKKKNLNLKASPFHIFSRQICPDFKHFMTYAEL
jgi:hypothetical protein